MGAVVMRGPVEIRFLIFLPPCRVGLSPAGCSRGGGRRAVPLRAAQRPRS